MKSTLTGVILFLAALSAGAQAPDMYGETHWFQRGAVDPVADTIRWTGKPVLTVIPVELVTGQLVIYSAEMQVYRLIERVGGQEGTDMYYAHDQHGINCFLFITELEDYYKTEVSIIVRYRDVAWLYLCTKNR